MNCTVGVITYNRPDCVSRVLRSLRKQTRTPDEVVVVDDSESRATRRAVERFRSERTGFPVNYASGDPETAQPGARNQVIDWASGDVVCFVDDDIYCGPTWLETIHDAYAEDESLAGVGGPALITDEDLEPLYDWYLTSRRDLNRINDYAEDVELAEFWIPPEPVVTDFLLGANMSFRLSVLEDIGGFDTDYRWGPAYYEETDVMATLKDQGQTLLYHPDALVNHVKSEAGGSRSEGGSHRRDSGLWFSHNHIDPYWFFHNHVIFARKHSNSFTRSLVRLLFRTEYRPAPLWRHLLGGLRRGDVDEGIAAAMGYVDGLARLRDL